jgi:hypothetical protein
MKTYISEISLYGVKNIEKEVQLDFYNVRIPKKFVLSNSNIKAIYGENGSGKSGIIHAVDIYFRLVSERNFLTDSIGRNYLDEIINKNTKTFSFRVVFVFYDEKNENKVEGRYEHRIIISRDNDNNYHINRESLSRYPLRTSDPLMRKVLLDIEDGVIKNSSISGIQFDNLVEKTKNLLKSRSIVNLFIEDILLNVNDQSKNERVKYIDYFQILLPFIFLRFGISVVMDTEDRHDNYLRSEYRIMSDSTETNQDPVESNLNLEIFRNYYNRTINDKKDWILKENEDKYYAKISRMTNFIKLFKRDLQTIRIESKENGEILVCEKVFEYKNGLKIHIEFESTGIKKLVRLFEAFENLDHGGIVFIDEFDANLHDVYLSRIVEYFSLFGTGQLCFTTHNLGPMEYLRNKHKYSIDFLSSNQEITSWVKKGNYSVVNLYRDGMIENAPFNIDSTDFIGIFNTKSKEI